MRSLIFGPNVGSTVWTSKILAISIAFLSQIILITVLPVTVHGRQNTKNWEQSCDPLKAKMAGNGYLRFNQRSKHHRSSSDPLILTPLIEKGRLREARQLAQVDGSEFGVTFDFVSYSGYLTVNKKEDSNLFFWFIPAQLKPKTAPFMLRLSGAPSMSILFGTLVATGPFQVDMATRHIKRRPHSTTLTNSVLYIESTVGLGYSFTGSDAGYAKSYTEVVRDVYKAVTQFFKLFPSYQSRPLFVGGKSFPGKFIPAMAYKIYKENSKMLGISVTKSTEIKKIRSDFLPPIKINLQGMIMGDGVHDELPGQHLGEFLYSIGIVNETGRLYFDRLQTKAMEVSGVGVRPNFENCCCSSSSATTHPHPHYQKSAKSFATLLGQMQREYRHHFVQTENEPNDHDLYPILGVRWSNLAPDVHEATVASKDVHFLRALHVGGGSPHDGGSHDGVDVLKNLRINILKFVKPFLEELLNSTDVKVLIYIPRGGVEEVRNILSKKFVKELEWRDAEKFRKAHKQNWHVDGKIVGYSMRGAGLTLLFVEGCSHFFPLLDDKINYQIQNRFMHAPWSRK